ncbi:MAG: hypothetical protein AB2L12_08655 [Smithellaceae bacterium]
MWSTDFPRQTILEEIPPEEMSRLYRNSIPILTKELPENDENTLLISRQCLLAGLREEDIDIILKAALIEEKNHKTSSAIMFYDSILELIDNKTVKLKTALTEKTWHIFIQAVEHRSSLSFFHPSLKKANQFLFTALNAAHDLNDIRSQAALELLIGQHYWMSFQYNHAVQHFNQGWEIITQIEDEELYKQGLKVKGLTYVIEGQIFKAIEVYEQALGEIESADDRDFYLFAALNLALCYTQVGMPQRGLGICERIQKHSQKITNGPLLAFALVSAGMILLEIGQYENSYSYFKEALNLAVNENIPMVEVLSGIGLSSIECRRGNFDLAVEHYKVIWRIRKSSWYYVVNFYPLIETTYILHSKGIVQPIKFGSHIDFLYHLKKDESGPLMYVMFQRLQIGLSENKDPLSEKIRKLLELEETVTQMGAIFELARIRVELARLFKHTDEQQKAENYAQQAYDFFEPFAPNCFPSDLKHLIPQSRIKMNNNERLLDIVVEIGNVLNDHENLERLLTNIITSISRLTGAERAALFIKDENTSEIKMIASRNFLEEEIKEEPLKRNQFCNSLK